MAVAQQLGHHRQGNARHHALARVGMSQVVQAHVFNADIPANLVPEGQILRDWLLRGPQRWEQILPGRGHAPLNDLAGLGTEIYNSRSCLAVFKSETVSIDLTSLQANDFIPATACEQKKADDVGLYVSAPFGNPVERRVQPRYFVPRQEPREPRSPVRKYRARRVGADEAALYCKVQALAQEPQRVVRAPGSRRAVGVKPVLDGLPRDPV